jgi:hypothetical protein
MHSPPLPPSASSRSTERPPRSLEYRVNSARVFTLPSSASACWDDGAPGSNTGMAEGTPLRPVVGRDEKRHECLVTAEAHGAAGRPSLRILAVFYREQGARHWRARRASLESKVPVTGEQGGHHSRARCPSLESKAGITREQGARHWRARCRSLESKAGITR